MLKNVVEYDAMDTREQEMVDVIDWFIVSSYGSEEENEYYIEPTEKNVGDMHLMAEYLHMSQGIDDNIYEYITDILDSKLAVYH